MTESFDPQGEQPYFRVDMWRLADGSMVVRQSHPSLQWLIDEGRMPTSALIPHDYFVKGDYQTSAWAGMAKVATALAQSRFDPHVLPLDAVEHLPPLLRAMTDG